MAENGYDVVGIDQRGYGFSEGRRGLVESKEMVRDDILAFTQKINDKFGGGDVPHFTIGHSLGGTIQLLIAAEAPELFAGMTLIAPFVALNKQKQELFDKLRPMAKVLNWIMPTYSFTFNDPCPTW